MKSVLLLFLAFLFIMPGYAEDIDLSNLTYTELIALKNRINIAIWESEEWQEVIVPPGMYRVGIDIPAGRWNVRISDIDGNVRYSYISIGTDVMNLAGNWLISISEEDRMKGFSLYNPNHSKFKDGNTIEMVIELFERDYISIEGGSIIFSTYSGNPDFQFK